MTKLKPRWMVSYATRSRTAKREAAYGTSTIGGGRYGGGTQGGKATDVKSSAAVNMQSKPEGSLTLSSHTDYNRLLDDDYDVEKAMRMPAPLSPVFRKSESSQSSEPEAHAIPMQQLHHSRSKESKSSRPSLKIRIKALDGNAKAHSVLGMQMTGVGNSTLVFGGRSDSSPRSPCNDEFMGGIEVKRDVVVTTAPMDDRSDDTRPLKDPHSYRTQRR